MGYGKRVRAPAIYGAGVLPAHLFATCQRREAQTGVLPAPCASKEADMERVSRQTSEARHRRRQAQPWRIVPPFASAVLTDGRDGAGGDCAPPPRLDGRRRLFLLSSDAPCMQRAAGGAAKRGERSGASALLRHTARASCPLTLFAAVVGTVTEAGGVLSRLHIRRGAVMDRDASDAGDTPQAAAGAAVAHRATLCVSSPHGRARRSGRRLCATAAPGWTAEAVPAFE